MSGLRAGGWASAHPLAASLTQLTPDGPFCADARCARGDQGTFAPGAPKEYMDTKMSNGVDGKFSTHLGLAGMPRRSGLNTDKTRSKACPDPTAWGYNSLSNF